MPNSQYCCFTGHRDLDPSMLKVIESRVKDEIVWLAGHGVDRFITGGARGFDLIAGRCVLEARASNPRIKLIVAVPCRDQERAYSNAERLEYRRQLRAADKVQLLSDRGYFNGCMQARDRYMVDRSATCVCWLERETGGTFFTVNYARRNFLTIVNLCSQGDIKADISPREEYFIREDKQNDLDGYFSKVNISSTACEENE